MRDGFMCWLVRVQRSSRGSTARRSAAARRPATRRAEATLAVSAAAAVGEFPLALVLRLGLRGAVPRFARIRYRAATPGGGAIDRTVSGFHARVVQHECDHLDGILYPQRMTDLRLLTFLEEGQRYPIDLAAAARGA